MASRPCVILCSSGADQWAPVSGDDTAHLPRRLVGIMRSPLKAIAAARQFQTTTAEGRPPAGMKRPLQFERSREDGGQGKAEAATGEGARCEGVKRGRATRGCPRSTDEQPSKQAQGPPARGRAVHASLMAEGPIFGWAYALQAESTQRAGRRTLGVAIPLLTSDLGPAPGHQRRRAFSSLALGSWSCLDCRRSLNNAGYL